jgi:hypothetical protein
MAQRKYIHDDICGPRKLFAVCDTLLLDVASVLRERRNMELHEIIQQQNNQIQQLQNATFWIKYSSEVFQKAWFRVRKNPAFLCECLNYVCDDFSVVKWNPAEIECTFRDVLIKILQAFGLTRVELDNEYDVCSQPTYTPNQYNVHYIWTHFNKFDDEETVQTVQKDVHMVLPYGITTGYPFLGEKIWNANVGDPESELKKLEEFIRFAQYVDNVSPHGSCEEVIKDYLKCAKKNPYINMDDGENRIFNDDAPKDYLGITGCMKLAKGQFDSFTIFFEKIIENLFKFLKDEKILEEMNKIYRATPELQKADRFAG